MATVAAESLLTAEEYCQRPDSGYPEELVRGRVVRFGQPSRRHGQICVTISYILRSYVKPRDLGHVLSNDSGVITERNPDTVRGADVAFYSYARLAKGPLPATCGPEVPELIFEVLSPSDRWPKVLAKVAEYLEAGVSFVVVLDDERRSAQVFGADRTSRILSADDELTFPEILGDFRVAVRQFFD
ncbi:MAG: Uma2 family endonuclease [Isosphaeraceae bacterium]|nr:Uma2 family endonuclease [Isosphaeraceae bacterium]